MKWQCSNTKTALRRHPERGSHDLDVIRAILDEALICHVGFVHDGSPVVIPTIHARSGDRLFLHGSPASRMLRDLASGVDVSVTATLVDGLVLAKSWFHHSLNYRSVVIFGTATVLTDDAEKTEALRVIVEHVKPGRTLEARPPNPKELAGTLVLALPINDSSAKVRTGGPIANEADADHPAWAGVVPISARGGA
ncbi:MAG: pyridoxamine 5'-phosphate oxidase family protein [Acidimicrobiales bacterium]